MRVSGIEVTKVDGGHIVALDHADVRYQFSRRGADDWMLDGILAPVPTETRGRIMPGPLVDVLDTVVATWRVGPSTAWVMHYMGCEGCAMAESIARKHEDVLCDDGFVIRGMAVPEATEDDGPCLMCGEYGGDHMDGCLVGPHFPTAAELGAQ